MSDPRVDDLLRDLRAELSIEPSPQLVARVRARIDNRSNSTPLIPAWTVGVALLMTIIALGIAPDRQVEKSIAPAGTSRGQVAQPVAEQLPRLTERAAAPDRAPGSAPRRPAKVRSASAAPEPLAEAEILVPPDQAIALRRILIAMRTGRSPVPPAASQVVDAEGRLPAPEAIGIPEITIQPITPPADGGRNKER
jgi:hypothetical protein